MEPKEETKEFIRELEDYAGRNLHYARELGILMETVRQTGMIGDLDDILLRSKFIVKTLEIIKRIGPNAEGAKKLEAEFQAGVGDVTASVKKITARLPEREAEIFDNAFFAVREKCLDDFIGLLADFAVIKNWTLDGKPLPFGNYVLPSEERKSNDERLKEQTEGLKRIHSSSILIIFMFIMFLLIDPPVTVISWIFVFGILLSLSYIFIQSRLFKRTSSSIDRSRK